jgi:hypothetical protein
MFHKTDLSGQKIMNLFWLCYNWNLSLGDINMDVIIICMVYSKIKLNEWMREFEK